MAPMNIAENTYPYPLRDHDYGRISELFARKPHTVFGVNRDYERISVTNLNNVKLAEKKKCELNCG